MQNITPIENYTVDTEFYFQWHLTERCNRRCLHCYQTKYKSDGELDKDKVELIANKLVSALDAWNRRGAISLTGGEPWLRRDLVFELCDHFQSSGLVDRIDILTNGELIDEQDCADLAARPLVRRVQLSLEGATNDSHDAIRGKGSFDKTLAAINRLKHHNVTVAVMITLSKHNVYECLDMFELLSRLGVDYVSVDRFIPEGQANNRWNWLLTPEELKQIFQDIYNWGNTHSIPHVLMFRTLFCLIDDTSPHVGAMCSVGANALTIMHDGTLYPCRRLPIPLGNVLTDSLYDIWYTSPVLWQARTPINLEGKCKDCQYIPVCRGCRAMALAVHGNWLAEDPLCWKK